MFERHDQRFAFWTDEARNLHQGILQPVYRVLSEEIHIQAFDDRSAVKRDWWTSL